MNETQRAYLAGIIDGEGSIMMIHHNPRPTNGTKWEYWVLRVSVSNCDRRLIAWLMKQFPDSNYSYATNTRPNQRTAYQWRVDSRKAVPVLDAAYPYLLLKREQADLAYQMIATHKLVGRAGHDESTITLRRKIAEEMKFLNHRGR